MAASSLTSIYPPFHLQKDASIFSYPTAQKLFKSNYLPFPCCSSHHKLHQSITGLPVSSNPISKPSVLSLLTPSHRNVSKFYAEKIATLLLGSLIFVGSFKTRPVLAEPVQQTESFEQKRDSQFENSSANEEEAMCEKLLLANPKDVMALKMVVNVKMKKGKTGEAVEYVERLIEIQPNEMEWRLLEALCHEMLGNLIKARSLFKNILKQKPLLLRALHGLAMVMHKNHEGPAVFEMIDGALQVARREKKVNEERNIRILAAQMHIVKGDFEVAMEQFQDLIDENPRDFRPYLCQGIVYSLLDKRREAEERFEIYRSLVPEEFPQRGFLDDVVLAAKTESRQQLQKELQR